jgi:Uma2 family endonuclease
MATIASIKTAAALAQASDPGRCESVGGELIMMSPSGFRHGRIVARLTKLLSIFVDEAGLGVVTGAEAGFWIGRDPDTVRAPDVAFVT